MVASLFHDGIKSFVPLQFLPYILILGILLYFMLCPSYIAQKGDVLLILSVIETCRVDYATKARLVSTCVSDFREGGLRTALNAALFATLAAAASGIFLILLQCIRASCLGLSVQSQKEIKEKRKQSPRQQQQQQRTAARENQMESIKERLCDLMSSPTVEPPKQKLLKMVVFLYDDKNSKQNATLTVKDETENVTHAEGDVLLERGAINHSEPKWVGWISVLIVFFFALHLSFIWAYTALMLCIPMSNTWKVEYAIVGKENTQVGIKTGDLHFTMSGGFVTLNVLTAISIVLFSLEVFYMYCVCSKVESHVHTESFEKEKEGEMMTGHLLPDSFDSEW